MVDITIYNHIYKNGGTSIREGFKHHPRHKLIHHNELTDNKIIYGDSLDLEDGSWKNIVYMNALLRPYPVFFTGKVNAIELNNRLPNIRKHYVISLRNPVKRLMSAYNYFCYQCKHIYNINQNTIDYPIDFKLWFLNRYTIEPVRYDDQQSILNQMFSKIKTDEYTSKVFDITKFERMNNLTVTFVEHDYIPKIEQLLETKYPGCDFKFDLSKKHSNQSSSLTKDILKFKDIDIDFQAVVLEELESEIDFYNQCKARWLD